ncbi:hydroxypyruvate isomerase family protein [Rhizobium sp. AN64]|uniref:hydroxypyruvate isomerase family protein n=1 Tax=Rhizobium sp. AN64 TaxID=3035211 RepID=UPI002B256FDD|nr:TIM barrel protein [Rhizobium sp. AN64]
MEDKHVNRFSAHIGYLYTELPLVDRIAAAARDGFTAIEHPEPFAIPAKEMRERLDDLGLEFCQLSSGLGDPSRSEKGLAALRGREAEFRQGFLRALDYAEAIKARFVHPMAGVPTGGGLDAGETYQANLGWALEACGGTAARVLIEAITAPGYYVATLNEAIALQDCFQGRPALLFDTYHAMKLGEDPARWVEENATRVGHVHIADYPGRNQPGSGTIDFVAVLRALEGAGYGGAVGFEYVPTESTEQSLRFLSSWKHLVASNHFATHHSGANS